MIHHEKIEARNADPDNGEGTFDVVEIAGDFKVIDGSSGMTLDDCASLDDALTAARFNANRFEADTMSLDDGMIWRAVDDLRLGDLCDLQADPFADSEDIQHAAEFELYEVLEIERESGDCIRVDFNGASVGYPPGFKLPTRPRESRDDAEKFGW